jgi:hypothetical protein
MDICIWRIAGNGEFARKTCFSRIGGDGSDFGKSGVGMSAARTSAYATKAELRSGREVFGFRVGLFETVAPLDEGVDFSG